MTFSDLVADARRISDTNAQSYTLANVTASINRAFERVTNLIRTAQGRWQQDDSNNTDFPIATATLTANQQDYELDPNEHYRIERVEVKDTSGGWTKLMPIDQVDVYGQALTDFLSGAGIPQYYDKVGNSLFLYPKPSYTQAASLKLYYERGPSYFTVSDTTKPPGFNPLFHRLLSLWAAHDYAFIKQLKVDTNIQSEIARMEEQLLEYYSLRDMDDRVRLKARIINYR